MARRSLTMLLMMSLVVMAACSDGDSPTQPGGISTDSIFLRAPIRPTSVSDSLYFLVLIRIDEVPIMNAPVELRSNRDGVIASGLSDAAGMFEVTVPPMSRGKHLISLMANLGDSLLRYSTHEFENTRPVRVQAAVMGISVDGVSIAWQESNEPTFKHYEVRRWVDGETYENSVIVAYATDRATTAAVDPKPPLVETAHYAVTVMIDGNLATTSHTTDAVRPNGPVLGFDPYGAALHPTATVVYVMGRVGLHTRLVAIDYISKAVVADRTFDHRLRSFTVADNGLGVEVYAARADDGFSVLDAMTLTDVVQVPTGYSTASVSVDGLGHVYVSLGAGGGVAPVRSYDRGTWEVLSEGGKYTWSWLYHIPGTTELMGATTGTPAGGMVHFQCDAAGQILDWTNEYAPGGTYGPSPFGIDATGRYVITGLEGSVYLAKPSFDYKGVLPNPVGRYTGFTFSTDGEMIYAGHTAFNYVGVFDTATLSGIKTLPLQGYARRLLYDGEYLISVSRTDINRSEVCVELVRLTGTN